MNINNRLTKVLIIHPFSKKYRSSLWLQLFERGLEEDLDIHIVYSETVGFEKLKNDSCDISPVFSTKIKPIIVGKIFYYPIAKKIFSSELIVIHHQAKFFWIYVLSLLSFFKLKRVVFWGTGYHTGSTQSFLARVLKKAILLAPSHWLAYTKKSALYLIENKYPAEKITVVQNSTDTKELKNNLEVMTENDLSVFLKNHNLPLNGLYMLYCGGLYDDKRLDDLIKIAELVNKVDPRVHLLIVGNGPDLNKILKAKESRPWMHYLGVLFGLEKAKVFKAASLFLCPGLVGLAIVDAFAAGLPLFTLSDSPHSPEIAYFENEFNGYMVASPEKLTETLLMVISNPSKLSELRFNAKITGKDLSIEKMAENFILALKAVSIS